MADAPQTYDLEAVHDEQIAPLMARILEICKQHRIPMVASFAYGCNSEGRFFSSSILTFDDRRPPSFLAAFKTIREGEKPLLAFTITPTTSPSPSPQPQSTDP